MRPEVSYLPLGTEAELSSAGLYAMFFPVLATEASHCKYGIGTGLLVITILVSFFHGIDSFMAAGVG